MKILRLLALLLIVSSCTMMYDDLSGCQQELRVRFRYDMNMEFADAFAPQVKTLTLYAYSPDGALAFERTEKVADIVARGGYMTLDNVAPGHYSLYVWAEGEQRHADSYTYGGPATDGAQSLTSRVTRQTEELNHDLTPLFHGKLTDADLSLEGHGVATVTVPLVKNTNIIRVVLQNASGERLNQTDFSFFIDDDNTFLAYDNAPLPDDSVCYRPWSQYDGVVGDDSKMSAVVAEMTVNRLLTSKHPRLRVRNNLNGKTIFSIPLNDYALLVKGNYNKKMTDQEYLDRQSEYNFVFFIDDNHNWLAASILINSWTVVLHNTDI